MSRLDDPARLAAIENLAAIGDRDDRFDRVVRMARRLFDVPVAAVNLVDDRSAIYVTACVLVSLACSVVVNGIIPWRTIGRMVREYQPRFPGEA